jgi:preprotein translocase SecE subunit
MVKIHAIFKRKYNFSKMTSKSQSPFARLSQYLKEVVQESKYITWPPTNQVVSQFFVVIALSSALTGILYCIDLGLSFSVSKIKEVII